MKKRVQKVRVVRSDDRRAFGRNVLGAGYAHAKPQPEHDDRERSHERVQARRDPTLACVGVRALFSR